MKTANALIITCQMLGAVLSATEPKSEAVEKLGLKESTVEGATIYYEPCLEEKLEVLKKAYSDYRQRMAEHEKPQPSADPELASKKIAIVNDICKIVGDDEMKAKLISIADDFINSGSTVSLPLTGSDNVIYLMLQSTTKDYLRSGGTLPNYSYDKEADMAEYKFFFGSDTDNASN